MDYQIDYSKEKGYVRIKVFHTINADLERSFAKEAIATAKQKGLLNYYADVRGVPNITNALDKYILVYEDLKHFGLDRASKVAILHSQDDYSHDFIETVFCNAGYKCKLFIDETELFDWLKACRKVSPIIRNLY